MIIFLDYAAGAGWSISASITADAEGGMVDVQDRRPVVLSAELAREWLSPDLTKDRAKEIARDCGQPADDVEWYPVSKDVGNVPNKGEYLIKSIT
jgi:putative SOS response-associated peptidase YedK